MYKAVIKLTENDVHLVETKSKIYVNFLNDDLKIFGKYLKYIRDINNNVFSVCVSNMFENRNNELDSINNIFIFHIQDEEMLFYFKLKFYEVE